MVPNTSDDLPDPETPVNTVSRRLGISTLTSFRLFTRAPWTRIRSWLSAGCLVEEAMFAIMSSSIDACEAVVATLLSQAAVQTQEGSSCRCRRVVYERLDDYHRARVRNERRLRDGSDQPQKLHSSGRRNRRDGRGNQCRRAAAHPS